VRTMISMAFERFGKFYLNEHSATIEQYKVMDCIKVCKTEKLGFNTEACEECGSIQTHYNSCGNRHCPNCQAVHKDRWILQKQYDLLPVKYHHTVFTIPAELRTLFMFNKALLYNLLFTAAWDTIQSFAQNPKNRIEAKMGMIAILHTWKQNLDYHPHLHCIIPAGGMTSNNKWKSSPTSGDYLFNTHTLGAVFKGKFLSSIKQMYKEDKLAWEFIKMIPKDASVTASGDLLTPLATRKKLYSFGLNEPEAWENEYRLIKNYTYPAYKSDYILIHTKNICNGLGGQYAFVNKELADKIIRTKLRDKYVVIKQKGNFILLRRIN